MITIFLQSNNIAVLNPKGLIANQERDLMVTATLLMLIVVIPVFILTFFIAWKYRASNKKAKYTPEWDHNRVIETIWWVIPLALIMVLSVMIWKSSHDLDPFKPIETSVKPLTIQVVALQWKWLFIYPESKLASVNFIQFPEDTPINFEVTADAPMNSFWIPSLGGQIYAMSGMSTKLHLMADEVGDFKGSSANISGRGFSGMRFTARASSKVDFETWLQSVKQSEVPLSMDEYNKVARPSENHPAVYYSSVEEGLYNKVIMKYMVPMLDHHGSDHDGTSQKSESGHHH